MLNRRQALLGLSSAAALAPETLAETRCLQPDAKGMQTCNVTLSVSGIETIRQHCDNWCWAACIQTVFALHGRKVSQETIDTKLFGPKENCKRGATGDEIIAAINGDWTDEIGFSNRKTFRARAEQFPQAALGVRTSAPPPPGSTFRDAVKQQATSSINVDPVIQEIEAGNPLIIGAIGHATVLAGIQYQRPTTGSASRFLPSAKYLTELAVLDPWPDSPAVRQLTMAEASNAFWVFKVAVT